MDWYSTHTALALRPGKQPKPSHSTGHQTQSEIDSLPEEEELWIACRACHQLLTRPSHQLAVHGSHQHTFANPGGVVFEIGCYRSANGCRFAGPPSTDFSWFAGYSWQIAICSACQTHLGWLFRPQNGEPFFGLIIDRLTEISITT